MLAQSTEMVPYSKATDIAEKFAAATGKIRDLVKQLGEQVANLEKAFASESHLSSDFNLSIEHQQNHYKCTHFDTEKLIRELTRNAWAVLIEKLGIKKLMPSSERAKIDSWLHKGHSRNSGDKMPELPEITAESIVSVMSGMVQSAPEYMTQKTIEVYKWLVPQRYDGGHVTNQRDRVGKKVIKTWCVEEGCGGKKFRVSYHRQGDLAALDCVFHALDGKGVPKGHNCPLADAIAMSENGTGETEYFRFKCYQNRNLHIEFKRLDLLQEFNRIAVDGNSIGGEKARGKKYQTN